METSKLNEILKNKAQRDNALAEQKANAENTELATLKTKADSYLPKIAEWIDNANTLRAAGVELYSSLDCFFNHRLPKDRAFCTDGDKHLFGFYKERDGEYRDMGIKMGGADGERDIHTDGSEWWIEEYGHRKEMTLADYKKLMFGYCPVVDKSGRKRNRIEQFEERFNEFLMSL